MNGNFYRVSGIRELFRIMDFTRPHSWWEAQKPWGDVLKRLIFMKAQVNVLSESEFAIYTNLDEMTRNSQVRNNKCIGCTLYIFDLRRRLYYCAAKQSRSEFVELF